MNLDREELGEDQRVRNHYYMSERIFFEPRELRKRSGGRRTVRNVMVRKGGVKRSNASEKERHNRELFRMLERH